MEQEYDQRELARRVVEATPDAMIVADEHGIIRLWNPGAATIFGYSAAEAIGQRLDLIVPEPYRARHWAGYGHVLATGETRYARELLAVPALRKDGSAISIELTVTLLEDDAGSPIGICAILRDVTAHWKTDRALRRKLADVERQRGERPLGEK